MSFGKLSQPFTLFRTKHGKDEDGFSTTDTRALYSGKCYFEPQRGSDQLHWRQTLRGFKTLLWQKTPKALAPPQVAKCARQRPLLRGSGATNGG